MSRWATMYAVVWLCACGMRTYRAAVPQRTRLEGREIEIVRVIQLRQVVPGIWIHVKVRPSSTGPVRRAWLASETATPCSEGASGKVMERQDWEAVERAPHSPAVVRFDHGDVESRGFFRGSSVTLDLLIEVDRKTHETVCMRATVVRDGNGPSVWASTATRSIGTAARFYFPREPVGGMDRAFVLSLRAGRWLGPIRLRLEGNVGFGRAAVPVSDPDHTMEYFVWGAGFAVDTLLWHRGRLGLGAELGYEFLHPRLNAWASPNGSEEGKGLFHGPRAGLRFLFLLNEPGLPGLPARPDDWSVGLEFFVSRWFDQDGASNFVFGFAFTGDTGF